MASSLLQKVGYQWTLRIWAAMFIVFGSIALLGVKPRLPVLAVRDPVRIYNVPRYLRQFKFVLRPLFIVNVVSVQE